MIMTQEQLILKAQEQFEQVKAFLRQACSAGKRIDQVESDLWGQMLQTGRLLLEGYVAGHHQGDLGPTLGHEGRTLRRLDQMSKTLGVLIVCILELYHVLERLWSAAYCFHPESSDQAQRFVAERLRRLLEGEVGYVIGGLKQMGTKHKLSRSKQDQLLKVIVYLKNNRSYMRYDQYLSQGYPIGSGVVEGACRHVVKDRMEGTGMRWCMPGAQAMLNLRAVYLNGDWDAFQCYRMNTTTRKLYPCRQFIRRLYRKTG